MYSHSLQIDTSYTVRAYLVRAHELLFFVFVTVYTYVSVLTANISNIKCLNSYQF
jgi:hypothetical protein